MVEVVEEEEEGAEEGGTETIRRLMDDMEAVQAVRPVEDRDILQWEECRWVEADQALVDQEQAVDRTASQESI